MYDKTELLKLTNGLVDRLAQLRPGILDSSLYGSSNLELQKQELIRQTSELVHGVRSNWQRQLVSDQAKRIEGLLQTAAATGLIGQKDLQEYLGMIDDIYVNLDQEN